MIAGCSKQKKHQNIYFGSRGSKIPNGSMVEEVLIGLLRQDISGHSISCTSFSEVPGQGISTLSSGDLTAGDFKISS